MFKLYLIILAVCNVFTAFALLDVRPLSNSEFGAHIQNVNLESILDEDFDVVHNALLRYKVIVIKNQADLTIEGQRQFTQRFGPLHVHLESSSHFPGYTDVNVVSNIKNENGSYIGLFGAHVENFHSDLSWAHLPTKITVLKSVIRADNCGDTIFADTNAAWSALDPMIKEQIDGLQGHFCYLKLRDIGADGKAENLNIDEIESAAGCAVHPLVTTHPITGRRNLYANPSHTASVVGLAAGESEELLQLLFEHTAKPEFELRHTYADHDVIMWDNRAVHHRATSCSTPRKLVRTTVSNDSPPIDDPDAALAHENWRWMQPEGAAVSFDLALDRVNAQFPPRPTLAAPMQVQGASITEDDL